MGEVKKLEAEAAGKTAVESKKEDQETLLASQKEMKEWLRGHRLHDYAADVTRIAGENVVPSDLQYLTDENVEEIGGAMTHVEKMRFQAALQALREEGQAGTE